MAAKDLNDCTPADVLTCDVCHKAISDLALAMVFWETDKSDAVPSLRLAHKGACDDRSLGKSAELHPFTDPDSALEHLAGLLIPYKWSGEQATRLALIAWAASQ